MQITAKLVKELRDKTGVGMMECKKALKATDGDISAAIDWLRTNSSNKVSKMNAKKTGEGLVLVRNNAENALIVEVNCQTDFVSRDDSFIAFANAVADTALSLATDDIAKIMATHHEAHGDTLDAWRQMLIQKIGENMQCRRIVLEKTPYQAGAYCHRNRIGALVMLDQDKPELARDIALHVAAINPGAITPDDIPAELIAKEKEIFSAQAAESGKPAEIIEKMVQGRIKKFQAEISMVSQDFVKDPSKTVGELLKEHNATVTKFVRLELGEGVEKDTNDFAAEVMAQVQGQ